MRHTLAIRCLDVSLLNFLPKRKPRNLFLVKLAFQTNLHARNGVGQVDQCPLQKKNLLNLIKNYLTADLLLSSEIMPIVIGQNVSHDL